MVQWGWPYIIIWVVSPKKWPKHWKRKYGFFSFLCDFSEYYMNLYDFYNLAIWEQYCTRLPMVPGVWPYIILDLKCDQNIENVKNVDFYHFYVILVNVPWIYMIFIMGWDGNSIVKACPWSQGDGHIYYSGWLDPKSVQNIKKVEM